MSLSLTPFPAAATTNDNYDLALQLTGREHLSHSAVSTYQRCSLQYYFRYVRRLPEAFVSASLVFGSAVHAAIARHYRDQRQEKKSPPLSLLRDVYCEIWNDYASQTIRFGRDENREVLDGLADRVLTTFQKSELASVPASARILGIEEEFRGALIPGCPDILARVDLILDAGDALLVRDFKTSRCAWSREHVEQAAGQLLLYHDLVQAAADGRPLRLEFAVVTKTKAPAVARHEVPTDRRQIERAKRIVSRVWQAIQAGLFFPNPGPTTCGSCPFQEPCRKWMG